MGFSYFVDKFGPTAAYGGWPMIQKNWNSTFEWEVASGLARAYLNLGVILTTFVFLDTFNASQNVIHVSCDQPWNPSLGAQTS